MSALIKWITEIMGVFNSNKGPIQLLGQVASSTYKMLLRNPADAVMNSSTLANLYSCIIPIGLILIVIAFFSKIMEMALDDKLSVDLIIKEIIVLVIVLMAMDNALVPSEDGKYDIGGTGGWLQKIYHFATDITDDVFKTIETSDVDKDAAENLKKNYEKIDDKDSEKFSLKDLVFNIGKFIKDLLATIFTMLILSLFAAILNVVVFCVGIYRAVKIGIYIILAPIGMASCYEQGAAGLKYFKKLVALILQEMVMVISLHILFMAATTDPGIINAIILGVILISTVVGSEKKAKALLG